MCDPSAGSRSTSSTGERGGLRFGRTSLASRTSLLSNIGRNADRPVVSITGLASRDIDTMVPHPVGASMAPIAVTPRNIGHVPTYRSLVGTSSGISSRRLGL